MDRPIDFIPRSAMKSVRLSNDKYQLLWGNFKHKYGDVRIWVINRVGNKNIRSWTKIRELMREMENELFRPESGKDERGTD